MAAISRKHMTVLTQALDTLKKRHLSLHNLGITHDEFLALFAPPEHWPLLRSASEIAQVSSDGGAHFATMRHESFTKPLGSPRVDLVFWIHQVDEKAPLLPRNQVLLKEANPELVQRLTSWVIERVEIGYQFALAKRLLERMNEWCESPKQIRFCWPSLVALCALNLETEDLAHKLRSISPLRNLPALAPEVREACRSTAKTITIASLISDDVVAFSAPVTIAIHKVDAMRDVGTLGRISPDLTT